jgi:pentatricopeptide repeat protein
MSERFWRNLSTALGWLAIGMFFALATFCASIEIKDLDLWLHLRMGWWICHHGFVPNYDVLSCTITGKPWVNHEWLFQVLIYEVQKHFGFNGLISMQSLVVVVTLFMMLFLGYSRERQWVSVAGLLMVLMVYQTRFTIRPDIFSILFFVTYIFILSMHINRRWTAYALVVLQILWTNMHGFFFFGPLLVLIGIFSEFIKRRVPLPYEWNTVGRLTDEEYGSLKKILLLVVLACCVNPLTFQGAWYPIDVLFRLSGSNKIFFKHIVELQRPFSQSNIFTETYKFYKMLIVVSFFSFIFNRRKIDISGLLIWVIFLAFSLAAVRNLVFFAVPAYMVMMINTMSIPWENIVPVKVTFKIRELMVILVKIWFMIWMLNYGLRLTDNGYFDFDTYLRKSEFFGVSKRVYPYRAVDFLVREKIKANIFNDFNSGAYLLGRTYPNIRVFIDGRTEVYGAKFFEEYQKIWTAGDVKVFSEFMRKDNITGAFLNNAHQQIRPESLKMFHGFKDWAIVYLDYDAIIFLKRTPEHKAVIDKFSVDLSKWKPKPMDLEELGTKRIDPFPFTGRAYILDTLDADDAAIKECREALRVAPDDGAAYYLLGKIYGKRKDYNKAFENYRLAALYLNDRNARFGMAMSYEYLNDYDRAINQYQRLHDANPKDAEIYYAIIRTYAKMGKLKKAESMLAGAKKLGFEDKVENDKIRDIINGKKKAAGRKTQGRKNS